MKKTHFIHEQTKSTKTVEEEENESSPGSVFKLFIVRDMYPKTKQKLSR